MNGGRKFGFVSLGPIHCSPGFRALEPENNGECMTEITPLVKLHNKALSKNLRNLEKQLKGFMYSNFNFYPAASERINNPSKYGKPRLSFKMSCHVIFYFFVISPI